MVSSFRGRAKKKVLLYGALIGVLLIFILTVLVKLPEVAGQNQQKEEALKQLSYEVVETTTANVHETEAIISEESTTEATTTTTETTTTQETTTKTTTTTQETTTQTTTTMEETTAETTTVGFNEGRNVFLTEEDLNLRFNLSETYLTAYDGTYYWESADMGRMKESYYACSLSGVFNLFSEEIGYDYSAVAQRSDGVWCIMTGASEAEWLVCVAADLNIYPRGSLVRTSLGYGIVCDTGEFIYYEDGSRWFDIAVASNSWGGTDGVFNQ